MGEEEKEPRWIISISIDLTAPCCLLIDFYYFSVNVHLNSSEHVKTSLTLLLVKLAIVVLYKVQVQITLTLTARCPCTIVNQHDGTAKTPKLPEEIIYPELENSEELCSDAGSTTL